MKDDKMFGQKMYLEFRSRLTKEVIDRNIPLESDKLREVVDIIYEDMKERIHDEIPVSTPSRHINT